MRSIIDDSVALGFRAFFQSVDLIIEYWGSEYDQEEQADARVGHE